MAFSRQTFHTFFSLSSFAVHDFSILEHRKATITRASKQLSWFFVYARINVSIPLCGVVLSSSRTAEQRVMAG